MWDGFLQSLEAGGPEAAWQGFLDFRNGAGTWENYPEKTRGNFLSRTEGHVANIYANKSNPTTMAELATIAVPTLAIRSEPADPFRFAYGRARRRRDPGLRVHHLARYRAHVSADSSRSGGRGDRTPLIQGRLEAIGARRISALKAEFKQIKAYFAVLIALWRGGRGFVRGRGR